MAPLARLEQWGISANRSDRCCCCFQQDRVNWRTQQKAGGHPVVARSTLCTLGPLAVLGVLGSGLHEELPARPCGPLSAFDMPP